MVRQQMTAALQELFKCIGFLGTLIAISGCVTVSVGEKKGKPAEDLQVSAPPSPFQEIKATDVDQAWQNPKNGNSIAYSSDCYGADPSLISIQQTVLQGLSDSSVDSEQKTTFNSREAIDTQAAGTVDGVKVKIRFLVFKKNNCNFTLNYFAVAKHFETDLPVFQTFLNKFRAP